MDTVVDIGLTVIGALAIVALIQVILVIRDTKKDKEEINT